MSIMELGALGEFLGSMGVIATLIYLAIQIRQNTHSLDESRKLAMAHAYQARATAIQEAANASAHSQYWPSMMVKFAERGLDALSPEERMRLRAWHLGVFHVLDSMHFQYERGFLDKESYQPLAEFLVSQLAVFMEDTATTRTMRPSFREEVDRILSESEAESEENAQ